MKKYLNLLITATVSASPLIVLTSCGSKLECTCILNKQSYFASEVNIGSVYTNKDLTFSFTLNENCFLDYDESRFAIFGHRSHSFNSPYIKVKKQDNTYKCTVKKEIIKDGDVVISLSAYKVLNYEHSQSSADIYFNDDLTSYPVENDDFTIAFKVLNNKAFDLSTSTVTIGSTPHSLDRYLVWEAEVDSEPYTFLTIPGNWVNGDVSLALQTKEGVNVSSTSYPEYTVRSLSKAAKGNDFYMYFILADSSKYVLDTDKAIIKVGDTTLSSTDYEFSTLLIPSLKINGDKVTADISVDVPTIECFSLYDNKPDEYQTVETDGEKVIKGKEYKFTVAPIDNTKKIQWSHASTYISVNDEKLRPDNGFTYSVDEKGIITVTVEAEKTVGDLYCHFVTA